MISWGKNNKTFPLYDVLPLKRIKDKSGKYIYRPITWHRDWEGWKIGKLYQNGIDEALIALESKTK